jgi:prepilin-type N-terminal cleavage/methylation domain-containing protein
MNPGPCTTGDRKRQPPAAAAARAHGAAPAFTLVELLVVVSIILVLVSFVAGALSAARRQQKVSATRATIKKLESLLLRQLETYSGRSVTIPLDSNGSPALPSGMTAASYRAWKIRRDMISADMPDRWSDVEFIARFIDSPGKPIGAAQRTYAQLWNSLTKAKQDEALTNKANAGAECLFMVVMLSGLADCLGCDTLGTTPIGDQDGDGFSEFWDAWGNPIDFVLWPTAVEIPPGSGRRFFSGALAPDKAFPSLKSGLQPRPTLGLRPLIYSGGPDGRLGIDRLDESSNLARGGSSDKGDLGRDCGTVDQGGASTADPTAFLDNVTNFDPEAAP